MPSTVAICGMWIDNHWLGVGLAGTHYAELTYADSSGSHDLSLSLSHLARYLVFTKI